MAKINIKYFGIAQDIAGASEQTISVNGTLQDLLNILYQSHQALNNSKIQIAHNLQIISKEKTNNIPLSDGDEVVFLPPFAGG